MIPAIKQGGDDAFIPVRNPKELTRWKPAPGEHVELRRPGSDVRRGVIEAVMRDNSGFWLAADGVEPRVFVSRDDKEQSIRFTPALSEEVIPL
jgi:hypothetical protein